MQPAPAPPPVSPRNSGWQFSLRDLLWLLLFIAGWLGIWRGCDSVWWTDGEGEAFVYYLGCGLVGLIGLPFCLFTPLRRYIAPLTVVIAMLFAWHQHADVARLRRIEAEVVLIAQFLEGHKNATGEYPSSISQFRFSDSKYSELIRYWSPDSAGKSNYVLHYDLFEGDMTNREYSPRGWYYYPD